MGFVGPITAPCCSSGLQRNPPFALCKCGEASEGLCPSPHSFLWFFLSQVVPSSITSFKLLLRNMPQQRCYFLAPTRNNAPDGLIRLGNVIADPSQPDEPLFSPPVVPDGVRQLNESDWELTVGKDKGVYAGIWLSFLKDLIGAGGEAAIEWSKTWKDEWKCEKMRTLEFTASDELLQEAISDRKVQEYLKKKNFHLTNTKIYMIVGVKIATGASLVSTFADKWRIGVHIAVDATPLGVPISGEPKVEFRSGGELRESVKVNDDFVIGYRLRRLKVNSEGIIKENKQVQGIFRPKDNDQSTQRIDIRVDGLDDEDTRGQEFRFKETEVIDDDGESQAILVNVKLEDDDDY